MVSNVNPPELERVAWRGYRWVRGLVRLWLSLALRKIRLLRAERLPASAPSLLLVNQPAGFLTALCLLAALERPARCLLNEDLVRGFWRNWLARRLGMIPCGAVDEARASALNAAREALMAGEMVMVFAGLRTTNSDEATAAVLEASALTLEAESGHPEGMNLKLVPVHIFSPAGRWRGGEMLIYFDTPLFPLDYFSPDSIDVAVRKLAVALDEVLVRNGFSLQAREVRLFLGDLEEVLRAALKDDWATRPNWKQEVEGFTLSQFLRDRIKQMNFQDPGRLVALRDDLNGYREALRQWSLEQAEVEAGGPWLTSPGQRAWYWLESLLGLLVALYGFANHLLAWVTMRWTGLLKKESGTERTIRWLLRGMIVLGFYAGQVLLCGFWEGRAAAGYYALTLPLTGAFLWRYRWLVRARTRLLLMSARLDSQAKRLRRRRGRFVEELNRWRDLHDEALEATQ